MAGQVAVHAQETHEGGRQVDLRRVAGEQRLQQLLRVMQAGRRQRFDLAGRKRHRHAVVEAHQLGQGIVG